MAHMTAPKKSATSDKPPVDVVAWTRTYLDKNRALGEHQYQQDAMTFHVHAGVFSPMVFEDTAFFSRALPIRAGKSFLEIGCGAGVISVIAARKGAWVHAVDNNMKAVQNTRENARLHGMANRVDAYHGDLFDPLPRNAEYDVIFWNAPFITVDTEVKDLLDGAVFDHNYEGIRRYLTQGPDFLSSKGALFLGFSSTSGDLKSVRGIVEERGARLIVRSKTTLVDEISSDFSLELLEVI